MQTIKNKIGAAVLLCVLAGTLIVGAVSFKNSRDVMEKDSVQILDLMCDMEAETINALLSRIEQSVITLSEYAAGQLTDLHAFQTDADYVRSFSENLDSIALNAANNTEGAMTVYLRYNPEYTVPTSGVFYSRSSAGADFERLVPTDFSMYDPSDTAHVGWYYIPVKNGKPTWLSPYLNENINVEMISYVIPLIIDGESVGIVGMDINFQVLLDIINSTQAYDSGYAFLVDGAGNIVSHPDFELNASLAEVNGGELAPLAKELEKASGSGGLFSYTYGGETYRMTFIALANGMKLAITAPESEIFKEASQLVIKIAVIVVIAILVSLLISVIVIHGIVKPIRELNLAAQKIAGGELDVTLTCRTKDEVGMLSDSFRQTVDRLRTYIVYIDEINSVLRQIANGNLCFELRQQYEGDFARLKDALLMLSGSLSSNISEIRIASEQVSSSAGQVSDGAQTLSSGSSTQSASVEELSRLMEEMLSQSHDNAENAKEARLLTSQAGEGLAESSRQMKTMSEAMTDISNSAKAITQTIKKINDIALQTNILALNASIEASRAGEAGKGFHIVASEVKDLAAKSVEAAANIEGLVTNAIHSIANGEQIAGSLQEYLAESVNGAQQVAGIVQQITESSLKQQDAVVEIRNSVDQISGVVQQNSATSEEQAAASEELNAQAQVLEKLVERFRLPDADSVSGDYS